MCGGGGGGGGGVGDRLESAVETIQFLCVVFFLHVLLFLYGLGGGGGLNC